MKEQESKSLFWYRVKFLTVIAVFLSPFVGGWLALYVFEVRPESGNYGELIQPVKKLSWPILQTTDGKRLESGFDGKWSFLLFIRGNCGESCKSNLFYMRQIRILLGRNTDRLQNVLVSAKPLSADLQEFLREYPDLIVIDNYVDDNLYRQFQIPEQGAVGSTAKIYVVDPDNNLMMHYPADNDQNRVLDDIRKLMKLSQIG
jgi:cytochrome oxidase Cu insertion factor (SCO1/SenC/PrrC family)